MSDAQPFATPTPRDPLLRFVDERVIRVSRNDQGDLEVVMRAATTPKGQTPSAADRDNLVTVPLAQALERGLVQLVEDPMEGL